MITRALVTGGAGFIGSNLVNRLIDDGASVMVVDDLSSGKLSRLADARSRGDIGFHQMDIRQPEIDDVIAKFRPEIVFHLAAQIDARRSVVDPVLDTSINLVGAVNVMRAAALGGVRRLVFSSSGGAQYGSTEVIPTPETEPRRPESPYGVAKGVTDAYLQYYADTHGLSYMSLGFANVYGPWQDPHGEAGVVAIFARSLLAGNVPTIFGDGTITRDYVFVDDVVDACVRAAERGGDTYLNIGTGRETSVSELYSLIAGAAGSDAPAIHAPGKDGDVPRSCLDATRAKDLLGWEPWIPLEDGIARTVDWFSTHQDF